MKLSLTPFLQNITSSIVSTFQSNKDNNNNNMLSLSDGGVVVVNGTEVVHLESALGRMSRLGMEWFFSLMSLVSPYITTPVLVLFIFPFVICLGIYSSALLLYIVRLDLVNLFRRLRTAVLQERDLLKAGREMVSTVWDAHVRKEEIRQIKIYMLP